MFAFQPPYLDAFRRGSKKISLGPDVMCNVRDIMDVKCIGVTNYIRCNVELKTEFAENGFFLPHDYRTVCFLLTCDVNEMMGGDWYVSLRVKEHHGYVMDSPLKPFSNMVLGIFENANSIGKLKGKFTLEALCVNGNKIGDEELLEKYVSNINARFEMFPDTSVKDYVTQAEKWLNNAKQVKAVKSLMTK